MKTVSCHRISFVTVARQVGWAKMQQDSPVWLFVSEISQPLDNVKAQVCTLILVRCWHRL